MKGDPGIRGGDGSTEAKLRTMRIHSIPA